MKNKEKVLAEYPRAFYERVGRRHMVAYRDAQGALVILASRSVNFGAGIVWRDAANNLPKRGW